MNGESTLDADASTRRVGSMSDLIAEMLLAAHDDEAARSIAIDFDWDVAVEVDDADIEIDEAVDVDVELD